MWVEDIISLCTQFCSLGNFCVLNFVISHSDWMPNGTFFGIHKSPVNPNDPLNISPQSSGEAGARKLVLLGRNRGIRTRDGGCRALPPAFIKK